MGPLLEAVARRSVEESGAVATLATYFSPLMVRRQRLFWAVATRRQLERWEPLVAEWVYRNLFNRQLDDVDVWAAQAEHHLALVAARHLLHALDLAPAARVLVDPTVRDELIEGRDLNEHWTENMPVFNVNPRQTQPTHKTGKRFAARNPTSGPYDWIDWTPPSGALLQPHVPAPVLHQLLDAIEADALAEDPELARFVPARAPSPWVLQNGEWWPKGEPPGRRLEVAES